MNGQILWDCHMHSSFSADSDTPMEDMIHGAAALGLSGICFTEHMDPDYPPTPDDLDFTFDVSACRERVFRLREQWAGRLEVGFGIEFGLQPHLKDALEALNRAQPFDFVIGSSHVAHGKDPYYPAFYEGRSEQAAYGEYFESILENLRVFGDFDVYGHLDYAVRYGPNQNRAYSYEAYREVLDEILRTLVEKGIGLELNTGGFAYGLGEPNPCRDIIRRYRELGGEIITVGADAHGPERIAFAFDRAQAVLTECGFRYYTVFQGRKPQFFPL